MMKIISLLIYSSVGYCLPPSYWPGCIVFSYIRSFFLRNAGVQVGKKCQIERGIKLNVNSDVIIGDFCQINENCQLKNVQIGNYVMIAPNVVIFDKTHNFSSTSIPMALQGVTKSQVPTIIEDDVWIGQNCIIMPGVKIEKGAIVGAGSVVTKNIDKYSIVAGNPAKLIRKR